MRLSIGAARVADGTLLVCLWGMAALLPRTAGFGERPGLLGAAITLDLLVSASLLHLWLGVRQGELPRATLGGVLGVGLALAWLCVPHAGPVITGLFALSEALMAAFALSRGAVALRAWRELREQGEPAWEALEGALQRATGSALLAGLARAEGEGLVLALTGWWRRAPAPDGALSVTHHQEASWLPLAAVIAALSLGEGAVAHWGLTELGWPELAWLVSALHAYGLVWLAADAHALRLQPTRLDAGHLHLQVGLRWRARLHRLEVRSAERISEADPEDLDLSVLGGANVRLTLVHPVTVRGPLGMRWQAQRLALQVDEPERLLVQLLGESPARPS